MIINMTPHPIIIISSKGERKIEIPSTGLIRLKAETVPAGEVDGVPLTRTEFGEPEGLPEYQEDGFIIVSQLVKTALPLRKDLLVPAEVVRDEKGNIVGCRSLGR